MFSNLLKKSFKIFIVNLNRISCYFTAHLHYNLSVMNDSQISDITNDTLKNFDQDKVSMPCMNE